LLFIILYFIVKMFPGLSKNGLIGNRVNRIIKYEKKVVNEKQYNPIQYPDDFGYSHEELERIKRMSGYH